MLPGMMEMQRRTLHLCGWAYPHDHDEGEQNRMAEMVESLSNTGTIGAEDPDQVIVVEDPEVALQRQYNRREFLTYTWGAATTLMLGAAGVASFQFLYPRFRAGEFGGAFSVDEYVVTKLGKLPEVADPPFGVVDGKFWFVQTEEGAYKAIYMVCTHLGCLYKWEPANWRFECPCHGSKFTHDGFYIEGPAPRSLDYFDVTEENGTPLAVETGKKTLGDPSSESPARRIIT